MIQVDHRSDVPRHSFNMTLYDKKSLFYRLCSKKWNMTLYGELNIYEGITHLLKGGHIELL